MRGRFSKNPVSFRSPALYFRNRYAFSRNKADRRSSPRLTRPIKRLQQELAKTTFSVVSVSISMFAILSDGVDAWTGVAQIPLVRSTRARQSYSAPYAQTITKAFFLTRDPAVSLHATGGQQLKCPNSPAEAESRSANPPLRSRRRERRRDCARVKSCSLRLFPHLLCSDVRA